MPDSSAQLQFAAELVLFLAAAAGLAVVALCGTLVNRRTAGEVGLTLGFIAFGTASFLHGGQIVEDGGSTVIVALRTGGGIAVLAGCLLGWMGSDGVRMALGAAAVMVAAATLFDTGVSVLEVSPSLSLAVVVAGGVTLGAAVLAASRQAIAARVAATTAATLLIVVLVLGVAVSAVLVGALHDGAHTNLARTASALSQLSDDDLRVVAETDEDLYLGKATPTLWLQNWHASSAEASIIGGRMAKELLDPKGRPPDSPANLVIKAFAHCAPVKACEVTGTGDGRLYAVAVVSEGRPPVALIASTSTRLLASAQDKMFRNLFLVALAGVVVALLFAVAIGARIGVSLSRLRTAAEAIQDGDLNVHVGIDSADEVGVVGRAFDSMALSLRDREAAEARLRGRLEAVVDGMGEALIAFDGAGRITDFNGAAAQLLEVSRAAALGRPVDRIARVRDDEGTPIALATPVDRWNTSAYVEAGDGRRVPVALSVGRLQGPAAEDGGSVVVLADLTREREVEQMKKQFLSRAGHELRHPLVPIIGYAEILNRKDVAPEPAREMLGEMLEQSRKMLRIVEMLEFLAADGAGHLLQRAETLDVSSLIDAAVQRWRERLGRHEAIRSQVHQAIPTVVADRECLARCIDELVDNAVKFTVHSPTVVVAAEPAADGAVVITVSDNGQGMTISEQQRAFDEFMQGDPSDTRSHGGLGLGLAYVRRVSEAHGGVLTCRSTAGEGSTFSLVIPRCPSKARLEALGGDAG